MINLLLLEASMCLAMAILVPRADLEVLGHSDFVCKCVQLMAEKSYIVLYHVSAQASHRREQAPLDRN